MDAPPLVQGESPPLHFLARRMTEGHTPQLRSNVAWWLSVRGNVVKVSRHTGDQVHIEKTDRGAVGPMSRQSRLRFLVFLNSIDYDKLLNPQFILLTYPDVYECHDYKVRSLHRYVFIRYVESLNNTHVPCVWRVEWLPRQSGKSKGKLYPHWHLIVWNSVKLSESWVMQRWISASQTHAAFQKVGVRQVLGIDAVVKYVAKYVAKSGTLAISSYHNNSFRFGRSWGTTRKHLIPLMPLRAMRRMSVAEIELAQAWARTNLAWYGDIPESGFTVMGRDAANFFAG